MPSALPRLLCDRLGTVLESQLPPSTAATSASVSGVSAVNCSIDFGDFMGVTPSDAVAPTPAEPPAAVGALHGGRHVRPPLEPDHDRTARERGRGPRQR